MLNWFPGLRCYARYCANQFEAKTILDEKLQQGGSVADFLQVRNESETKDHDFCLRSNLPHSLLSQVTQERDHMWSLSGAAFVQFSLWKVTPSVSRESGQLGEMVSFRKWLTMRTDV